MCPFLYVVLLMFTYVVYISGTKMMTVLRPTVSATGKGQAMLIHMLPRKPCHLCLSQLGRAVEHRLCIPQKVFLVCPHPWPRSFLELHD